MRFAGQTKGAPVRHWLFTTGLSFWAVAAAHAQLNYLSDTRSVSGSASVSPNIAWNGTIVSYTGDYSAVATPSASFADFSGRTASGPVSLVYDVNMAGPNGSPTSYRATSTAWVDASQTSFLHPQELSYSSFESGPWNLDFGASEHGASSLLVSFNVAYPVAFSLTCSGTGDPLSSWSSYALSSANAGTLFSGDTGTMLQSGQYGLPMVYSGVFEPGDVYTLDLSSSGFQSGGGLVSDLAVVPAAVPEPSAAALAGAGAVLAFLWRSRRTC